MSPVCGPNHLPPATANSADFRKPSTRISFGGVFMKHRGTVLSIFAGVLRFAVAASAQTYSVLHTYPIGSGNYSGIGWPQVMSQGRDGTWGDRKSTRLNSSHMSISYAVFCL